jgi:tetratricopeptide (TPR) repeat protein
MNSRLYGRAAELRAVSEGLEETRSGSSRTFALVGEPGIGKTRLAADIARHSSSVGFTAGWGRSWEAGGAPPYWLWRSLFESLSARPASRDSGPLSLLWGRGAAGEVGALDPEQVRFELYEAVVSTLRDLSAQAPLLCILDDLHAADLPSLELTVFISRHLRTSRILWLLTWRDADAEREPRRDIIARIAREATAMPLRRLSEEETGQLIDEVSLAPTSGLRDALYRATAGNPLFLVETLLCIRARGRAPLPVELAHLPLAQGVAAVVRERVALLSDDAQCALHSASILGREVALDRWASAADSSADLLRPRAAEIVAAGILFQSGVGRWMFSHELVREAIVRGVPDDLLLAAHRRVALSLDGRIQAGERALAGERIHHGLLAAGTIEPRVLIDWASTASEEARAQCAYEDALAILERTLAVLGPSARRDASLLLALGRAKADLGDLPAARAAFRGAIELARASGDSRMRARAVLAYGARYVLGDIQGELIEWIDEASAALGDRDGDLKARLLARKAAALTPAARPEEALAMAREAVQMAAASGDDGAELEVAVAAGSAFGDFAHPHERIPVNQTLIRLAREHRDRALELRGLSRLVTDYLEAGDFTRADALLPERDALARTLRLPRFGWMEPLFRSMRAMAGGDLRLCDDAVAEADARARTASDANAIRAVAVHRTWLLLLQDDVEGLKAHRPNVLGALRSMPPVLPSIVRAILSFRSGELDEAHREIETLDPALPHGAVNAMATLAEVVAEIGRRDLAATLLCRLTPHADTYAAWGLFALTCGPPVAASLGLLLASLGDRAGALAKFDWAVERTTADGAQALLVWTRYWYGRALSRWLGEPARAKEMLETTSAEASELGMGRLAQRCRETLESVDSSTTVPASPWRMRPQGDTWVIESAGRRFLVPNLRGMRMLARLIANSDVEIHALDLVSDSFPGTLDKGDAGELLDSKARLEYRRRVSELNQAIEEAEMRADIEAAAQACSEREALARELARAVGLHGRTRRGGAAAERARVSAQRRIRQAIRRIGEADQDLGAHLDRTIRTGTFCVYLPRRDHK